MFSALRRHTLQSRAIIPRLRRLQHQGPHKEYFQNTGQLPAAVIPYYTLPLPPTFPAQPSIIGRVFRSVTWATLFGVLGLTAGASAITWEYIQPQFALGSEEELEMLEEIKDLMSENPLLDALSQDPKWKEQIMYMDERDGNQDKDFHFLSRKTLKGANGINMAFFSNIEAGATCLMFFPGSGVEGWPDVVHGGMISSLLQEAMEQTANLYHCPTFGKSRATLADVEINFRAPLQPGNVYAIFAYVDFEEIDGRAGLGTPLGSPERKTRDVHAVLLATDDPDWTASGPGPSPAILHADAVGRLERSVYMSAEDYTTRADETPVVNNKGV